MKDNIERKLQLNLGKSLMRNIVIPTTATATKSTHKIDTHNKVCGHKFIK